jgi:hypothetical protein
MGEGRAEAIGRLAGTAACGVVAFVVSRAIVKEFGTGFGYVSRFLIRAKAWAGAAFDAPGLTTRRADEITEMAAFALSVMMAAGLSVASGYATGKLLARRAPWHTAAVWVAFTLPWAAFWAERILWYPATLGVGMLAFFVALSVMAVGGFGFGAREGRKKEK